MFVKPHSFNHKNEHKSRPPQCDIYLWVASLRSFISFFIEPHFCKMILKKPWTHFPNFFLKKVSSKLVTYWYLLKVTHVNPVWTMSIVNIGSKVLNNDYVLNVIDWNRVRPMSSLIEFTWLGNPIDSYITNVSRQSLGYSEGTPEISSNFPHFPDIPNRIWCPNKNLLTSWHFWRSLNSELKFKRDSI